MCGRTACTLAPDEIVKACSYHDKQGKKQRPKWKDSPGGQKYFTSYNLAPGSHVPVLVSSKKFVDMEQRETGNSDRVITPMKWGLTPSWHQGDPYKIPYETNNCRAEGMLDKKTYKVPLQRGCRCVILVDGYFEWKTSPNGKQPYFFHFPQPEGVVFPTDLNKPIKSDGDNVKPKFGMKEETGSTTNKVMENLSTFNVEKRLKSEESVIKYENSEFDQKSQFESNFEHFQKSPQQFSSKNFNLTTKIDVLDEKKSGQTTGGNCYSSQISCTWEDQKTTVSKIGMKRKLEADSFDAEQELEPVWNGPKLLTMAGVYDVWRQSKESAPLYSFSVITVAASSSTSWCHHRMPAILSNEEEVQAWLDVAEVPLKEACEVIAPKECLSHYPVSKCVNNSKFQGSDCVRPIDLSKPKVNPSSNLMMNWLKSKPPSSQK